MKNHILALMLLTLLFVASCTPKQETHTVTIKGKVLSGDAKQVKFDWLVDNPITRKGEYYAADIDSNSNFAITIPIQRITSGRITVGRFYHDICLLPGDDLFIKVDGDTISYQGKGAAKNNFLYKNERAGLWDRSYYRESNNGKLHPKDFVKEMTDFKQRRLAYLEGYTDTVELDAQFVELYKIETQVIYNNLIQGYPRRYAYKNKLNKDSLELPKEYELANYFSTYVDDSKVICTDYVSNLRNGIYSKARELAKIDSTKNWDNAIYTILFDSLSGKTREYVLTSYIISGFSQDRYDSVAIKKFNEIEKDLLAQEAFDAGLNKYREKRALIGQPLHTEFSLTQLKDTGEVALTFGEMMEKYKGKVVYLDIWSLGCGPCIAAMPNSKKLKEKLSDLPIEFVYISQDRPGKELWQNIFEKTFTTENQYRMVNYQWGTSRMLKFMEIAWVPCYMIFDKQGQLVDFNADRPWRVVENAESKLEKTLKELAAAEG
ncbi:TlpA family protein disulfide reductase [Plebeiibacterium marinum]|uniref:TlpA family protein disulfide reductase n=1 Tax=Plebeiibacterium marinum TaxID=2992111 RepID=A0AAE3MFA1_9BACT|nr:TlpA disulfide reductase family protein [Plebeiobacterium marinum]MCW3806913.1 TlpA family protein disulfide reductase [Plebeiobacterium marinum]